MAGGSKLDGAIEAVLEAIVEGKTFRQMAADFEVSISTLHAFLTKDEHSARARAALALSSSQYAEKAELTLIEAVGTKEELSRAKELAQHYRWMASKRNPALFGEKVDVTSGDKPLVAPSIQIIAPS